MAAIGADDDVLNRPVTKMLDRLSDPTELLDWRDRHWETGEDSPDVLRQNVSQGVVRDAIRLEEER